jgi:hypothetical protein
MRSVGCFFAAKNALVLTRRRPSLLPLLYAAREYVRQFVDIVLFLAEQVQVPPDQAPDPLAQALQIERARLADLEKFGRTQLEGALTVMHQLRRLLEAMCLPGNLRPSETQHVQDFFARPAKQLKALEDLVDDEQWLARTRKTCDRIKTAVASLPNIVGSLSVRDSCVVIESQNNALRQACQAHAAVDQACEQQEARVQQLERLVAKSPKPPDAKRAVFLRADWYEVLLAVAVRPRKSLKNL